MRVGFLEMALVVFIILIIWGPTQLPKLARAAGKSKKILDEELKKDESIDEQQGTIDAATSVKNDEE